MKHLIRSSLIACALVTSGAALAQNAYVGGSVGQSRYDEDCTGFTCDKNDTGFKLFAGYMFNPSFGVEAHYVNLGKLTMSGVVPPLGTFSGDVKANGFGVSAVGVVPLQAFSLFGKVGVTYMDTKISGSIPGIGSASDSDKATNLNFGLGVGYNFTPNAAARLEWERFRAEYSGEKGDVDLISLGISVRF
jgi:OmpA-OmpF porin, OOP family